MRAAVFIIVILLCAAMVVAWSRGGPSRADRGDERAVDYVTMFIATVYLVLLALVVVLQWQYIDGVNADVRAEAAALSELDEVAYRLPPASGATLHEAGVAYASAVLNSEWPPAGEDGAPRAASALVRAKEVLLTPKKLGDSVGNIEDQALADLDAIADARADRLAVSRHGVPGVLLVLLVLFSILTVAIPLVMGLKHDMFTIVGMTALMLTVVAGLWFAFDLTHAYTGLIKVGGRPLQAFVSSRPR